MDVHARLPGLTVEAQERRGQCPCGCLWQLLETTMSSADLAPPNPEAMCAQLREQTLQACRVARIAARIVAEGIATGVPSVLDGVRGREKELDLLDRVIDQGVTSVITKVSEEQARELLACLKFIIDLERVGDLLLHCSNRAAAVVSRISLQDIRDLTLMASRLEKMLGDVHDAFRERDLNRALAVLRADAELDRLRNLIFLRHLENHEGEVRHESFHVLFMMQSLEAPETTPRTLWKRFAIW